MALEASLAGATNGAGDVHLEADPGVRWKYSGGGYTLAQLLEETSAQDFAEFMHRRVLAPLHMEHSGYGWTAELLARSATPYSDGKACPRGGPCFPKLAAAGPLATPADLARFAIASMPRFRSEAVLTDATLELMQTPAPASPDYGLGYQVRKVDGLVVVGHGGSNIGWIAQLSIVPASGDALVLMTNASHGSALAGPLEKLWLDALARPAAARR